MVRCVICSDTGTVDVFAVDELGYVDHRVSEPEACPAGCLAEERIADVVAFLVAGWTNYNAADRAAVAREAA